MYIFFDCFAGFDVFMALGSLLNMTKKLSDAQRICKALYPRAELETKELVRSGMEADRAFVTVDEAGSKLRDELAQAIKNADLSDFVSSKLCEYIKICADAKNVDPSKAAFDMSQEAPVLCAAAALFDAIENLKIKNVWISRVLCSKSFTLGEKGFENVCSPETFYIAKKYSLPILETECENKLLSQSGAAILAALGAKKTLFTPGNISKIGYGAGDEELCDITNILRAVVGNDDEEDTLLFDAHLEMSAFGRVGASSHICKESK